jgi:hypothetical protein
MARHTYHKPDGKIELQSCPCCCPPDAEKLPGKIHTRGFTYWLRVTHGEEQSQWHNCGDLGRMGALMEKASDTKTVHEFLEENFEQ